MSGAASWSFREDDAVRIQAILEQLLAEANARTALVVDRAGQMLATAGEQPDFDPVAFASLTAADFSANDQLARMLGEPEFGALFHQGERESLYLAEQGRWLPSGIILEQSNRLDPDLAREVTQRRRPIEPAPAEQRGPVPLDMAARDQPADGEPGDQGQHEWNGLGRFHDTSCRASNA